jgi:hypothetical protein
MSDPRIGRDFAEEGWQRREAAAQLAVENAGSAANRHRAALNAADPIHASWHCAPTATYAPRRVVLGCERLDEYVEKRWPGADIERVQLYTFCHDRETGTLRDTVFVREADFTLTRLGCLEDNAAPVFRDGHTHIEFLALPAPATGGQAE